MAARVKAAVRRYIDAGVPTLGVCFGHQLLADVLGGRVQRNPNGWELGLTEVRLTGPGQRDPLLRDLPDPLQVLQTHQDAVTELPPGAVRLAGNAHTPNQAFAFGDHVRAVQFHPEMDPSLVTRLLRLREAPLEAVGIDVGPLIAALRPTPQARAVLRNFQQRLCR